MGNILGYTILKKNARIIESIDNGHSDNQTFIVIDAIYRDSDKKERRSKPIVLLQH